MGNFYIFLNDEGFRYETEALTRCFIDDMPVRIVKGDRVPESLDACEGVPYENYLHLTVKRESGLVRILLELDVGGGSLSLSTQSETEVPDPEEECRLKAAKLIFSALSRLTEKRPRFGVLTGVRPVKQISRLKGMGLTDGEIESTLSEQYLVSRESINTLFEVYRAEQPIKARNTPDSYSLYIAMPFCPTRCSYCSFVSEPYESAKKLTEPYTELLIKELYETFEIAKRLHLSLRTVYFGGGTPTSVSDGQFERILAAIAAFRPELSEEYTIEAGRADTITKEKLDIMRRFGVGRISINPQSLNDDVLRGIGRAHTSTQVLESFELARTMGFSNINMDVIAGLPGDSYDSFVRTMDTIYALSPEGVTVHTLTVKRAASLSASGTDGRTAEDMLGYAGKRLSDGYIPYYLYRQKGTVQGLENIGYAKPSYEGLYNVYSMDETHTILACGAGGVTKLISPVTGSIERSFNFKYPYEYISGFNELLARKERIESFYESQF